MGQTTDVAAERLHRDLGNVQVTIGPQLVAARARVFVTDRRVLVYVATEDRKVELAEDVAILGDPPERNRGTLGGGRVFIETADGPLTIAPAGGCGCGSPLKSMTRPVAW